MTINNFAWIDVPFSSWLSRRGSDSCTIITLTTLRQLPENYTPWYFNVEFDNQNDFRIRWFQNSFSQSQASCNLSNFFQGKIGCRYWCRYCPRTGRVGTLIDNLLCALVETVSKPPFKNLISQSQVSWNLQNFFQGNIDWQCEEKSYTWNWTEANQWWRFCQGEYALSARWIMSELEWQDSWGPRPPALWHVLKVSWFERPVFPSVTLIFFHFEHRLCRRQRWRGRERRLIRNYPETSSQHRHNPFITTLSPATPLPFPLPLLPCPPPLSPGASFRFPERKALE